MANANPTPFVIFSLLTIKYYSLLTYLLKLFDIPSGVLELSNQWLLARSWLFLFLGLTGAWGSWGLFWVGQGSSTSPRTRVIFSSFFHS